MPNTDFLWSTVPSVLFQTVQTGQPYDYRAWFLLAGRAGFHTRPFVQVYCEMELNGGGYTFLNPKHLDNLTNDEVQAMFTDKKSFLMRVRRSNNVQAYGVLAQHTDFQYDYVFTLDIIRLTD